MLISQRSSAARRRTPDPHRREPRSRTSSGTTPANASGTATSRALATSASIARSSSHTVRGAAVCRSCAARGISADRPASWHAVGDTASSHSVVATRSWQAVQSLHSCGSSAASTRAKAGRPATERLDQLPQLRRQLGVQASSGGASRSRRHERR